MKRTSPTIFILISLLAVSACTGDKEILVAYSDPRIAYEGRIDTTRIDAAELYWPGTSIKINFQGASVEALIRESRGDNYYNVIIDEDSLFILRPDTLKQYHMLASNLSSGLHTVELFKRTEWDRGTGEFYGFRIGGEGEGGAKITSQRKED